MMLITSTQEERDAVLTAISILNDNPVVKHMSYAMISSESGLSPEKTRITVNDLVTEGKLLRCEVNKGKVARYYYVRRDS